MLASVEEVVGTQHAESWRKYLRGLWWSGLRVSESLQLYWDRGDRLQVDLASRRPMLRINGEYEKGGKHRLHPVAPEFAEFAEFLLAVAEEQRVGPVFDPLGYRGERPRQDWVSRYGSRIGKAAGIAVGSSSRGERYASSHDLRRSFGERWAKRILPQQLQELMRHEKIETTLKYYVGQDAQWDGRGVIQRVRGGERA